jgi:lipoprotein-anchoring transpeptidase ErfK/SrfK
MPIVAYFSAKITEGRDFSKAAVVTVNGQPNKGSWYFEASAQIKGYPLEAHYRPAPTPNNTNPYWPANASISLDMKTNGVSAGPGLYFNDSLTLRMNTGDAHISTVNCAKGVEAMIVTSNGKQAHATMPTSCGAAKTPTYTGTKIVMQKGESNPATGKLRTDGAVEMIGTGSDHYDLIVPWSVRITQSGEYVHAASWNGGNIGQRSTSNGCTNLKPADGQWFYNFALLGDVVRYVGTDGAEMNPLDGLGDWNIPWGQWSAGGLLVNH